MQQQRVDDLEGEQLQVEVRTVGRPLLLPAQDPVAEGDEPVETVGEHQVITVAGYGGKAVEDPEALLPTFVQSSRPRSS